MRKGNRAAVNEQILFGLSQYKPCKIKHGNRTLSDCHFNRKDKEEELNDKVKKEQKEETGQKDCPDIGKEAKNKEE